MKKASGVSTGLPSSYNDAKWLREGQRKVKGRSRKVNIREASVKDQGSFR